MIIIMMMVLVSSARAVACLEGNNRLVGTRRGHVEDVVRRVPVESLLEPGLVQEVADETDAPAQHEQTVQESVLQVVLSLRAIITLAV